MRWVVAFVIALTACASANDNKVEYWEPSLSSEGEGEADAAPATDSEPVADEGVVTDSAVPTGSCLHVEFTTVSNGGRYSPSHVEAVWVVDGAGKFVRTLALYGFRRTSNLYKFRTQTGNNTVDAITSATLKAYGRQAFDWNCLDASEKRVAAGNYTLFVEFAENDVRSASQAGPSLQVPFKLGAPTTLNPPAVTGYKDELVKVN